MSDRLLTTHSAAKQFVVYGHAVKIDNNELPTGDSSTTLKSRIDDYVRAQSCTHLMIVKSTGWSKK